MSNKEAAIELIHVMPAKATLEEIAEEIAILAAIQRGKTDADAGRVITHEEMKKQMA